MEDNSYLTEYMRWCRYFMGIIRYNYYFLQCLSLRGGHFFYTGYDSKTKGLPKVTAIQRQCQNSNPGSMPKIRPFFYLVLLQFGERWLFGASELENSNQCTGGLCVSASSPCSLLHTPRHPWFLHSFATSHRCTEYLLYICHFSFRAWR